MYHGYGKSFSQKNVNFTEKEAVSFSQDAVSCVGDLHAVSPLCPLSVLEKCVSIKLTWYLLHFKWFKRKKKCNYTPKPAFGLESLFAVSCWREKLWFRFSRSFICFHNRYSLNSSSSLSSWRSLLNLVPSVTTSLSSSLSKNFLFRSKTVKNRAYITIWYMMQVL